MGRCWSSKLAFCAAPLAIPCCCDCCGKGASGIACDQDALDAKTRIKAPNSKPQAGNNECPPRSAAYRHVSLRMHTKPSTAGTLVLRSCARIRWITPLYLSQHFCIQKDPVSGGMRKGSFDRYRARWAFREGVP